MNPKTTSEKSRNTLQTPGEQILMRFLGLSGKSPCFRLPDLSTAGPLRSRTWPVGGMHSTFGEKCDMPSGTPQPSHATKLTALRPALYRDFRNDPVDTAGKRQKMNHLNKEDVCVHGANPRGNFVMRLIRSASKEAENAGNRCPLSDSDAATHS